MKKIIFIVVAFMAAFVAIGAEENTDIFTESPLETYNQILRAIQRNNIQDLNNILATNNFGELINNLSRDGISLFQHALLKNKPNTAIIKSLLEAGADPNQGLDREIFWEGERRLTLYAGWTAVHIAVQCYCNEQILGLLFKHQGDFLKSDKDGWRPVDLIIHVHSIAATQFFIKILMNNNSFKNLRLRREKDNYHYRNFLRDKFPCLVYTARSDYFTISKQKKSRYFAK